MHQPTDRDRFEFVDALRGFALFGVFAANLLIFSGITYLNDEQRVMLFATSFDTVAYTLELFFIENKFMGLFSYLFGMSFWLFLSRAQARGAAGIALFYRRIFWLFVIGAVHGWLFWLWDILRFYAFWALFLPLFVRTPPRQLLAMALTASVLVPAVISGFRVWFPSSPETGAALNALALETFSRGQYSDVLRVNWRYDWYLTNSLGQLAYQVAIFGRLLLGLYVARTFNFADLAVHRLVLRREFVIAGSLGLIGSVVFAFDLLTGTADGPLRPFVRRLLVEAGHLGMTLACASGLALAYLNPRWQPAICRLAPMGRMALTWYLLQTALGIFLFYGFAGGPALMGQVPPLAIAMLAVGGYLVQVWLANLWLRRFRFGPAEWLWRSLTYWRIQPFRSHPHVAQPASL